MAEGRLAAPLRSCSSLAQNHVHTTPGAGPPDVRWIRSAFRGSISWEHTRSHHPPLCTSSRLHFSHHETAAPLGAVTIHFPLRVSEESCLRESQGTERA